MNSSLVITAQQKIRYTDAFLIGNIIRYQPRLPALSEVLGSPEETLCVWIEFPNGKAERMQIWSGWSVEELQQRIKREFQIGCEYLSLRNRTLHYKDKISDCEIYNESILMVRNNYVQMFVVCIILKDIDLRVIEVNVDQTVAVRWVKEKISKEVRLGVDSIRLFLDNQEMDSEKTFTDLGIYSDCTLYMKYSLVKGFRNGTKVRLRDNRYEEIEKITKNQDVLVVKPQNNTLSARKFRTLEHFRTKMPVKIQLAGHRPLQCTEGIYFFTRLSRWVICSDVQVPCLKIGDQIMLISRQYAKVVNICYCSQFHSIEMTNLLLNDCQGYSANNLIVSPALSVQILRHLPLNRKEYFAVEMHESMTIADLKQIILQKKNVSLNEQFLYVENKQTLLRDSLTIRSIYNDNLIIQLFPRAYDLRSKIEIEKNIIFTFDSQTKQFPYSLIMKKTCYEVITESFKQKVKEIPFFGVLLNLQRLSIDKRFDEIIQMESQAFIYETFDFIVIKFPQKFILSDILKNYQVEDNENFALKTLSRFKAFIFKDPYSITDKYKENQNRQEIKALLRNLHRNHQTEALTPIYQYISSLIYELSKETNYYKKCYRAMPIENELKLQQTFTKNTIITIREFLSCCPEKSPIERLVEGKHFCIIQIESITGKFLNSSEKSRQIVFLPYTYFIVDKIERNGHKWQVKLLEMPAPLTFSKDIILWVDDQPANNPQYSQQNLNFQPSKVEIVPLTSTAMAKRWFMQFGWIVNRLRLQMRVITDMVRVQTNHLGHLHKNYQAGVDLIQWLFNENGFTTPVLVFCSAWQKGQENLKNRGIREDRFTEVTNRANILHDYINFSKLSQ